MHFELSEEQKMIRQAARDFAQTELKPGVIERDEHQKFPAGQVKMMGELGFLGMMVDPSSPIIFTCSVGNFECSSLSITPGNNSVWAKSFAAC